MVAVSKPNEVTMTDKYAAPDAAKSNLPSTKQVVERP
jgi:hypothetical protein